MMTLHEARKWIHDHDYHDYKVDTTDQFFRFRQHEPVLLGPVRYRTIDLDGVGKLIIAYA